MQPNTASLDIRGVAGTLASSWTCSESLRANQRLLSGVALGAKTADQQEGALALREVFQRHFLLGVAAASSPGLQEFAQSERE